MLLLGKVESALIMRDGVGVGEDDLARIGSLAQEGANDARRRSQRSAGVVVEDGKDGKRGDSDGSGDSAVEEGGEGRVGGG